MLIPQSKTNALTTAPVNRQRKPAARGGAVLREDGTAASGVHAAHSTLQTETRPETAAENGWHTVVSKKGSKSSKHVNGDGRDTHNAAQPAGQLAPAVANPNTLTKSQKKRHARKRRRRKSSKTADFFIHLAILVRLLGTFV